MLIHTGQLSGQVNLPLFTLWSFFFSTISFQFGTPKYFVLVFDGTKGLRKLSVTSAVSCAQLSTVLQCVHTRLRSRRQKQEKQVCLNASVNMCCKLGETILLCVTTSGFKMLKGSHRTNVDQIIVAAQTFQIVWEGLGSNRLTWANSW